MGGDGGPAVIVPAAIRFLSNNPDTELVLYGLEDELLKHLPNRDPLGIDRCRVQYSSQIVSDQESPSAAFRHKQDSSMWLALQSVAQGSAGACISGGNTGALMAMGLKLLGINEGIDRPAICTALPRQEGRCYLLDAGANVDCSAQQLQQFALMATALVSALEQISQPPCALLNIGKESIKGNKVVKEAAELLAANPILNYTGFIEADELLRGGIEIVVCDGFVGNVSLKAIEGAARMILEHLGLRQSRVESSRESTQQKSPEAQLSIPSASDNDGVYAGLRQAFDPGQFNGAILLGLNAVVIKSHGSADEEGYCGALERAAQAHQADVTGQVARYLKNYMAQA
jgi:glycerol-3-phosphate acyltransferase PlsX